jgi:hypothetical protein
MERQTIYEWLANACPSQGITLTKQVDGKLVTFRMHFEPFVLDGMLRKAARNREQRSMKGPIEVRMISGL